jgi:hypothetical protein
MCRGLDAATTRTHASRRSSNAPSVLPGDCRQLCPHQNIGWYSSPQMLNDITTCRVDVSFDQSPVILIILVGLAPTLFGVVEKCLRDCTVFCPQSRWLNRLRCWILVARCLLHKNAKLIVNYRSVQFIANSHPNIPPSVTGSEIKSSKLTARITC